MFNCCCNNDFHTGWMAMNKTKVHSQINWTWASFVNISAPMKATEKMKPVLESWNKAEQTHVKTFHQNVATSLF